MKLSYVVIDEAHRKVFDTVLPETYRIREGAVALGALNEKGEILGTLCWELTDIHYEVEWLYVIPDLRRRKVGTGLMKQLFSAITGTAQQYPVVAQFPFSKKDRELYSFFLSISEMEVNFSHERYVIRPDQIRSSGMLHRMQTPRYEEQLFFELPEERQKQILTKLWLDAGYFVHGYKEWRRNCVPELCRCIFRAEELLNLAFVQMTSDRNLELSYLYSQSPAGLAELLSTLAKEAEARYPEAELTFDAVNEEADHMTGRVFQNPEPIHIYEALG